MMYRNGEAVEKDEQTAFMWYKKAAEQGYAPAQSNLAFMYDFGKGVEQDEREAAKWYRKAAKQGEAGTQYMLGWMYDKGEGEQNYKEAYIWFSLAMMFGYENTRRDIIAKRLSKDEVEQAQKEAERRVGEINAERRRVEIEE